MILCRLNEIGKIKMSDHVVTGVTQLANYEGKENNEVCVKDRATYRQIFTYL